MERARRRRLKKKAQLLPAPARLTRASARGGGVSAGLAAFGTRSLVRFAHWRGRRDAAAELKGARGPTFRALVQVNVIRHETPP